LREAANPLIGERGHVARSVPAFCRAAIGAKRKVDVVVSMGGFPSSRQNAANGELQARAPLAHKRERC